MRRVVPALQQALTRWWWMLPLIIGAPVLWWLAAEADDLVAAKVLLWMWTAGSGIGFLVSLALVRQTWLEARSLHHHRKNDRPLTLIADANFRREVFRGVEFMSLFLIGASIFFGTSFMVMNRFLLVLVVALLFGNTVMDLQERRHTSSILRQAIQNRDH